MHISLDSALGRQRRLNSVGESVLQIAPNAAAAYSLRSLTGGSPKVVRVRRASDNGERDFTSAEINSGEMVSWVNQQTIAPLDIQALEADGRTGDFLIAKAAYSLRSLGTRQATLAATGDTVARADGKFVAQVRRSSDDALKSFTADEVTDGTLLSFVGTSGSDNGFVKTWYDQSVTTQAGDTPTANHAVQATAASQPKIVSAGALNTSGGLEFDGSNDFFSLTSDISFENKAGCVFSVQDGQDSPNDFTLGTSSSNRGVGFRSILTRWFYTTNAIDIDNSSPPSGLSLFTALHDGTTNDPNVKAFVNSSLIVDGSPDPHQGEANVSTVADQIGARRNLSFLEGTVKEIIIYDTNQTDNRGAIEANIGEAYSISGIPAYDDQVDGFVETWYDQSGNNRPLIQTTASEQPLIVEGGTFLNGVKAKKATSNDTMQNLQVSTDGANANFGTDDWASGASSKLGAVYVGTVPADSVVSPSSNSVIWGGGRGVATTQAGGVSLQCVKSGTDSWKIVNERQGLSPSSIENATSLNTDANIVLYGTTDNREFTINVNGSGDTETLSADLDVREDAAISLFGSYASNSTRYYQRSSGGVCKECYLYAGDPVANIPALATSINAHYSIY